MLVSNDNNIVQQQHHRTSKNMLSMYERETKQLLEGMLSVQQHK